jgi:hypothetical protein
MKIIVMSDEALYLQIESLLAELRVQEPDIEIQSLELKRTGIGIHIAQEVTIRVATTIEHVMLAKLMEAGIKWGQSVIENHFNEPIVITIFGSDGIPLVANRVLPSGEIEELDVKKMPKLPALPVHLL